MLGVVGAIAWYGYDHDDADDDNHHDHAHDDNAGHRQEQH